MGLWGGFFMIRSTYVHVIQSGEVLPVLDNVGFANADLDLCGYGNKPSALLEVHCA